MSRISAPGVYDISARDYHADPAPAPSLSASIAKILDDKSPLHAFHGHPKLSSEVQNDNRKEFDLGAAAHQIILGSDDELVVIDPSNYPAKNGNIPNGWTNDAIRAARDEVYAAGKIPLLPAQYEAAIGMAATVNKRIKDNSELAGWNAPGAGLPERTLVWQEGDVWMRARLDWMPTDPRRIYVDVKTTETSVNPEVIGRYAMSMQWDIQESVYRRGLKALGICEAPKFRFVAVESKPPYAVAVVALPPQVTAMADEKVERAIKLWGDCLRSGDWPGYPSRTIWIEAPPWAFQRHQERWERPEPMFRPKPSPAALKRAADFQAP
jgi:hypothetical protein